MTPDESRTADADVPDRELLGPWKPWIVVLVLAAVGVAAFFLWRAVGQDRRSADLDPAFVYDVERYKVVPPEKIGYVQVGVVETGLEHATSVAAGPAGEIVVGGDRRILVFDVRGARTHEHVVAAKPWALAISNEGVLFVGYQDVVEHGPLAGPFSRLLEISGPKARIRITSIAVSPDSVYVADYGTKVVWRFGRDGSGRGRIGVVDPARNVPGFVVPSPYFDVLLARDGLLRIVDPGRRRVTAFTIDGDLEVAWGRASFALDGFSGCCNPSHIAQFPDGRFVTSEKGLARVKVHDEGGRFLTVVVGPQGLDTETGPCDVAVDSLGRVLVLDPASDVIRIFEPKPGRPR